MDKVEATATNALDPKHYFYAVGFVLAVLFAMLDPNPTGLSLPQLLFLWLVQGVLPVFLLIFSQELLGRITAIHLWSPWLKLVLSGVFASSIFAGPALLLDIVFGLDPLYTSNTAWLLAWWQEMLAITPPVTLGWLAANAPWLFGWQLTRTHTILPTQQTTQAPEGNNNDKFALFLRQLPEGKRGNLLYLKAELHYLLVVTDKGSGLILSSLKDAIADLPADSGIQTHRSFWVAKTAIKTLSKQGRQGQLALIDGSQVPVSRQQLATVQLFVAMA